ncbi:putative DRAP deaminase [Aspergillus japonicus CBS 114.51]|uniref:Putative DRAP deaminase n=2 Tax=Aspergillus TaxID=5052 RepID=A0A2V5I892_ASPV1|nr:putative DRAP deaminase [Aspergillus japonicus CBS 114.51]PYI24740.1 putative DRAP deaminase [Aspergillus violaceofuscus CBS 115571]RAH78317.1 putative DRAP deaminase [Aspergillus japonicus CBS 114.51]
MPSPHLKYMRTCLALAEKSPARPTNFRVGALLLSRYDDDATLEQEDRVLATGYTMERDGNTHAEQCCLANYAATKSVPADQVAAVLPDEPGRKLVMYVTMEPCGRRLSGNVPCVERIIRTRTQAGGVGEGGQGRGIQKVYFGVKEPGTFVGQSEGCRRLTAAGIEWEVVQGLEREILTVATAGHEDREEEVRAAMESVETNIDDISAEERRRQAQVPRNPKKRVMEVDLMG